MLISEAEMNRRLNSTKNLVNSLASKDRQNQTIVRKPLVKHTPPAPEQLKNTAATLVALGEKTSIVCAELGLSPKQVYSAKNAVQVQNTLDRVRELALDKTLIALGLMTDDKFANANLKDLSTVAANLSRVVDKMSPRESLSQTVQFIVHSPETKSLGSYRVVDV